MKTADPKNVEPKLVETRQLMTLSLCMIPTNQRIMHELITCPAAPLPFKLPLKLPETWPIGVGSFEHELPILLAWCRAINAVPSFTTAWCQWIDFTAHRQADRVHGWVTLRSKEISWAELQNTLRSREDLMSRASTPAPDNSVQPTQSSLLSFLQEWPELNRLTTVSQACSLP